MGREANCLCEWNGKPAQVKALLEPPDLILRGPLRHKIPFAGMKQVAVEGSKLHFTADEDRFCLVLGEKTASKWAKVFLTAPPSLAKKLGIASASTVRIIGTIDDDALQQALADRRKVTHGKADLILARVNTPAELRTAFTKTVDLLTDSIPIWIVYRKGRGNAIGESDVRATGLAAGVVDVKVASVSSQLTALKFVKRKSPSRQQPAQISPHLGFRS